jgi:diguanylate cyclase (GGDEF)-like protein
VAVVVSVFCGFILASKLGPQTRALEKANALREQERQASDRAVSRMKRELDELASRARDHTEVIQLLPDVVQQMFATTGKRGVGPLALRLVDQILNPEQSAIFVARPAQKRLALAAGRGLPTSIKVGQELSYGEGRLGYVAEHKTTMDQDDFRKAPGEKSLRVSLVKQQLAAKGFKGLRADVVAPIEDENGSLMGLICVGGVKTRPGQEKRLLNMVAQLTSVALTQIAKLRIVEELADVDGLTGVYNKRYFQKRLGDELYKAERDHVPLSLLILDIDHFKHYNDRNGHLEGDEVLKKMGQLLKTSIREDDVAARYGGEEFIVLYPGAGKELSLRLAEGLRKAVASCRFSHGPHQPLGALTISGGVATFPEDSRSGVDLIRCADQALYDAKAAGRNRVAPATPNYLT